MCALVTREAITLTAENPTTEQNSPAVALEHSETGPAALDTSHPLQAGVEVEPEAPTFASFGVKPEIIKALAEVGIERTFAIQELTLPLAMAA